MQQLLCLTTHNDLFLKEAQAPKLHNTHTRIT